MVEFLPHQTLDALKVSQYSSDFLFEKDASEAIGFTCGENPQHDVNEAGILSLICCINFFERIRNIYH